MWFSTARRLRIRTSQRPGRSSAIAGRIVAKYGAFRHTSRPNSQRPPGARQYGLTYSQFIGGIKKAGIEIDRKVLADLALREPDTFKALAEQAKAALTTAA